MNTTIGKKMIAMVLLLCMICSICGCRNSVNLAGNGTLNTVNLQPKAYASYMCPGTRNIKNGKLTVRPALKASMTLDFEKLMDRLEAESNE